jgi:tetrachlorobenzoquinone reductase
VTIVTERPGATAPAADAAPASDVEPASGLLPDGVGPGSERAATFVVRVEGTRRTAAGITSYELVPVGGGTLPAWSVGSHLDVHLHSGVVRQYSLCSDPSDLSHYRIGVLEVVDGRGGSREVHRELRAGVELTVSAPRNNFELEDAEKYVFVAGGIGITPMLAMAREVQRAGKPWRLVYAARSNDHFAFLAELLEFGGENVVLVPQDVAGHPDLAAVVAGSTGAQVYCCGPGGLMNALTGLMEDAGRADDLHLELFAPAPVAVATDGSGGFTLALTASGLEVEVGAEETALEAIRRAGVDHPSSCEMGFCGTCEVRVVDGEVDHRDDLYTEAERATGGCMLVCVSRALSAKLAIDV